MRKMEKSNKIITKDRIISVTIGILIGALITSCAFCLSMKIHHPNNFDNHKTQMRDKNRFNAPEKYKRSDKYNRKVPNTDNDENNQAENNVQSNNE